MRGVYRHFEEVGEHDIWRARVEISRGEWVDFEHAAYDRDAIQPPFWDLPLEEDHIAATLGDPLLDLEYTTERDIMQPAIMIAMGVGAAFVVVMFAVFAIMAWI